MAPQHRERADGEAFLVTNDDPFHFWDFARAIWTAAGASINLKEVVVIPRPVAMVLAMIMEWVFWIIFFGKKRPKMMRQGVRYSYLTRTYSIEKLKDWLGYRPLWTMHEGIKRGVEWFAKENKAVRKKQ